MGNSVLWIRNDFRFHDNTALINAINDIKDNENLIFIYHLDPELIKMETTSYAYFFDLYISNPHEPILLNDNKDSLIKTLESIGSFGNNKEDIYVLKHRLNQQRIFRKQKK